MAYASMKGDMPRWKINAYFRDRDRARFPEKIKAQKNMMLRSEFFPENALGDDPENCHLFSSGPACWIFPRLVDRG